MSGIGGTLAGNALSLAAMRATLGEVLTDEAFARMWGSGAVEAGVRTSIDATGLPWHVTRLGCRVEYSFRPDPRETGARPPRRATSSIASCTSTCSTAESS